MKIVNLLIKNAQIIATMDDERKEISNKSIYVKMAKLLTLEILKILIITPD